MTQALEAIIKQPRGNANASLIILHGLGADGHDFVDIIPQLQLPETTRMRFIFPNAPVRPVTINNFMEMRAWYDIKSLENLREEDETGIYTSQQLINQLISEEIKQGIAAKRIFIAGFSQGGAMSLFSGLRYPETLGGIMALSAYLPFVDRIATEIHPDNQQTPIFIAHGSQDFVVPVRLGQYTFERLKQLELPVEWHEYPMEHTLCLEEIRDINQWLSGLTS